MFSCGIKIMIHFSHLDFYITHIFFNFHIRHTHYHFYITQTLICVKLVLHFNETSLALRGPPRKPNGLISHVTQTLKLIK